jgi:hypothetical protein
LRVLCNELLHDFFSSSNITWENKIKKNEMGRACRTYGVKMRFIQGFGERSSGREVIWKT